MNVQKKKEKMFESNQLIKWKELAKNLINAILTKLKKRNYSKILKTYCYHDKKFLIQLLNQKMIIYLLKFKCKSF